MTLLTTEGVGGLQVRQVDGTWADVQHSPGAIIVNIADALEFWTGGKLKSTLHRVVLPRSAMEAASRYSMAFFVQPDFDTALQVFTDACVSYQSILSLPHVLMLRLAWIAPMKCLMRGLPTKALRPELAASLVENSCTCCICRLAAAFELMRAASAKRG